VLCVAGPGPFDASAAALAALTLRLQGGFAAEAVSHAAALEAGAGPAGPAEVRLCLLSVLEGGSSATGLRYQLRRLRRRLPPPAKVAIGLWHAGPDSAMLATLRAVGVGEVIVTTVEEALEWCRAEAAVPVAEAEAKAEAAA
jgi:hypothetical protein